MKKSSLNKLIAIYDGIGGLCSAIPDAFDGKYKGGTEKLVADFESVLTELGVKFAECVKGRYYVVSYMNFVGKEWETLGVKPCKAWGICTDRNNPDKSWCLTGFGSPEEAMACINDKRVFSEDIKSVEVIDAESAA